MNKKVLIISSSPRKSGNSETLAAAFAKGAREAGHQVETVYLREKQVGFCEPHPVKRTEKKYKVFPTSSHSLLAAFYAARQSVCFSIGVRTPRLRWTRLVL